MCALCRAVFCWHLAAWTQPLLPILHAHRCGCMVTNTLRVSLGTCTRIHLLHPHGCQCSWGVPIDMNGTTHPGMNRIPVHPCVSNTTLHGEQLSLLCITKALMCREKQHFKSFNHLPMATASVVSSGRPSYGRLSWSHLRHALWPQCPPNTADHRLR